MDITTADGTVTNVSLTGAVTVQDVLNQINTAGGGLRLRKSLWNISR